MRYIIIPATVLLMAQAPAPEPSQAVKAAAFQIGYCFGRNEVIQAYQGRREVLKKVLKDPGILNATMLLLEPPPTDRDCEGWTP